MNHRRRINHWLTAACSSAAPQLSIFCFPYAGGGSNAFQLWPAALPGDIEVVTIQYPGRENRLLDPPHRHMDALIADLYPQLLMALPARPYLFFGHSMGALVAFELTRRLRREGHSGPAALILSGAPAPHRRHRHPTLHNLPQEQFMGELRRLNGTPEEILNNTALMELIEPTLRADFEVCETYAAPEGAALNLPVYVFGGDDDDVTLDELGDWQRYAQSDIRLRVFPGDHFFINSSLNEVAAAIAEIAELAPQR
jgi:medium-chain acyl-[acyl-carrier-protein] hydrolase